MVGVVSGVAVGISGVGIAGGAQDTGGAEKAGVGTVLRGLVLLQEERMALHTRAAICTIYTDSLLSAPRSPPPASWRSPRSSRRPARTTLQAARRAYHEETRRLLEGFLHLPAEVVLAQLREHQVQEGLLPLLDRVLLELLRFTAISYTHRRPGDVKEQLLLALAAVHVHHQHRRVELQVNRCITTPPSRGTYRCAPSTASMSARDSIDQTPPAWRSCVT